MIFDSRIVIWKLRCFDYNWRRFSITDKFCISEKVLKFSSVVVTCLKISIDDSGYGI